MNIAIGSDHAGFRYKQEIINHLRKGGHEVTDYGTDSSEAVDYPKYIRPVAEAVAAGKHERGIVLGGSGNGEAITSNRVKGIRCGLCWNEESAKMTRRHNNANIIALGERMVTLETALKIVDLFITEPFEGGRHEARISQLDE